MPEVTVSGLIEGGKATSGPPFGPVLGPLGVNVAKIIEDVNKQTAGYVGIKVPVKIFIDQATKNYRVEIGAPPTSALILKELGIQKGAKTKDEVAGDITMEQLVNVAKAKDKTLYGHSLKEKVKQVAGTCKSMNITIEGMPAIEVIAKIEKGELAV